MIDTIVADFALASMPDSKLMRNIVACHHEFMDGSGYPAGLSGDAVPVEARIVTVSDIFDALTSKRPYKAPLVHCRGGRGIAQNERSGQA